LQFRKACTSIPLNIAEGCGCDSDAEFARFLGYSCRSSKEIGTCAELCLRVHPTIAPATAGRIIDEAEQLGKMIRALMGRL
jgi:four helix bundle protein